MVGARDFLFYITGQSDFGAHPVSNSVGIGTAVFPGVKSARV